MTDPSPVLLDVAPAAHVHALDIWDGAAREPLERALGFRLPAAGRSAGGEELMALRTGPTTWWLDGARIDAPAIAGACDGHGALTAIGGGLVRVRMAGPGWRTLLMANALFDAEDPAFTAGCCASTIIAHAAVQLHVVDARTCDAFIPASHAHRLIREWMEAMHHLD